MTKQTPDDTMPESSLLEDQIIGWLDGFGANEDASDIAQAFVDRLEVSQDVATRMLIKLCAKSDV